MRVILVLGLAVCAMLTAVLGQQAPAHKVSRAKLLTQLGSDDVGARSDALQRLRSDPAALADPKVKTVLVALLDRENHVALSDDEEYHEYVSWLAETVAKIVDWSDGHQVCVLANTRNIPDDVADHAKVAVPCLLQRYEGAPAQTRGEVAAMLVHALAKGRNDLDASIRKKVRQILLDALHDTDEDVKIPTVKALEHFGEANMIPALRVVAETDNDPAEHYAIRRWAAEAIVAIQKRGAAGNSATTSQK